MFTKWRFKNWSLRARLVALIIGVAFFVNAIGLTIVITQESEYAEADFDREYHLVSRLLAEYLVGPLEFRDEWGIRDVLGSLEGVAEIRQAVVYSANGTLMGHFHRESFPPPIPDVKKIKNGLNGGFYHSLRPVEYKGGIYGNLYLRVTTDSLDDLVHREWRLVLFLGLLLLLLSIFLAVVLQETVSRPIVKLVELTKDVSEKGDYSVRVSHDGGDEIAALYRGFNLMLERIETREEERDEAEKTLVQYREHLEELVIERTAELNRTLEELVKKERLATIGQLIATVSHELRNPLGTIVSSTYSIANKIKDKGLGVEVNLDRVEKSVRRCVDIVEELLDYSKTPKLNFSQQNVGIWLESAVKEIPIPDGIRLSLDIQPAVTVYFDPERLRRAVQNIVSNAYQAMVLAQESSVVDSSSFSDADSRVEFNDQAASARPEFARLVVQTEVATDLLKIHFIDSGPGIPAPELEKVFEPLYSTKSFGVGLGLVIVKQILEQHNGGISLASEVGKGTTVTIWLPRESPAAKVFDSDREGAFVI